VYKSNLKSVQKKPGCTGLVWAIQTLLPLGPSHSTFPFLSPLALCTCTKFCPDWLCFARVIPKRWFFWIPKSDVIQARLKACMAFSLQCYWALYGFSAIAELLANCITIITTTTVDMTNALKDTVRHKHIRVRYSDISIISLIIKPNGLAHHIIVVI